MLMGRLPEQTEPLTDLERGNDPWGREHRGSQLAHDGGGSAATLRGGPGAKEHSSAASP
jgi:hypothetical protein